MELLQSIIFKKSGSYTFSQHGKNMFHVMKRWGPSVFIRTWRHSWMRNRIRLAFALADNPYRHVLTKGFCCTSFSKSPHQLRLIWSTAFYFCNPDVLTCLAFSDKPPEHFNIRKFNYIALCCLHVTVKFHKQRNQQLEWRKLKKVLRPENHN